MIDRNPIRSAWKEHFYIPAKPPRVLSFDEEERLMPEVAQSEPYLRPFVTLAPAARGMRGTWMLKGDKASTGLRPLPHLRH